MNGVDPPTLIEKAAISVRAFYGNGLPNGRVSYPTFRDFAVVDVVARELWAPLRELHAVEWTCGNPRHTNPDGMCPECDCYCKSCEVRMPCPTVQILDHADGPRQEQQ